MSQASEQTGPTTVYVASLGRRLGAMLYDSLLILAIWMMTALALVIVANEAITGWWLQLVFVLEWAGFYLHAWRRSGQTVGMMAWRIKTLQESGATPSLLQCLQRMLVAPFSIVLLLAGYLWMYIDKDRRTWHDRFSDTVVVHFPKEA